MSSLATFTGPGGQDPRTAIRYEVQALTTPTSGDLLHVGQIFRSRIRRRTADGIDVNGVPFTPYSPKGPYYFYPNRDSAGNARSGSAESKKARATAAKGRFAKTGKIGVRTPFGIKYESYAAAKAAHGDGGVNLVGMEQHTHMLDTMMVRVGGQEVGQGADMSFGSELEPFEGGAPVHELSLGFYGPEADRAKGHNEGTSRLPKREFFALNQQDLDIAAQVVVQRMAARARSGHRGPTGGGSAPAPMAVDTDRSDWIPF